MAKPGKKGLSRIVDATKYSTLGIKAAFKHEAAFRQELLLFVVFTPLAFIIEADIFHRAVLIACLILVLIVEILNSAIEAIVDRIGSEHHELSGRAKDMGSAAVMMSLTLTAIIWLASIYHYLMQ